MTPEGKIKAKVNKLLDEYKSSVYRFMPVPSGYGPSSLDYIICLAGAFIAIETKAPGGKLTDRQKKIIADIQRGGGVAVVVDDGHKYMSINELREILEEAVHGQRVRTSPQER